MYSLRTSSGLTTGCWDFKSRLIYDVHSTVKCILTVCCLNFGLKHFRLPILQSSYYTYMFAMRCNNNATICVPAIQKINFISSCLFSSSCKFCRVIIHDGRLRIGETAFNVITCHPATHYFVHDLARDENIDEIFPIFTVVLRITYMQM